MFLLAFIFSWTSIAATPQFNFEVLTQREDVIWGFDFLPDGRIIFTERMGALNVYNPADKSVKAVEGAPKVWASGQGGMLDVRVHPTKKDQIYLTYSEPVNNGATTAWGIGLLAGQELRGFKKVFSAHEPNRNTIHFGSRIEFDGKGHLFVSVGDRDNRERAQDLKYHQGKILRFNEDGSIPADNPYVKNADAKPEIWSFGHRSPQGLAMRPGSNDLWMAEMGPRGGDEINFVKPTLNYGWPVATYGREYYGPKIGAKEKPGTEQPIEHWVPSISPSAMTFYSGSAFPEWKGDIFLANMSGQHLRRLKLNGNKVVQQEELLKDLRLRFRNVRTGPDGFLYISTDDGKLGRLVPRK